MKIFVLSDIHGDLDALSKAIGCYKEQKANLLLLLGDLLYHGPRNPLPDAYNPAEVAKLLNTMKTEIIAVRGNCDAEVDQMLLEFPILCDSTQLFVDGSRIFATHGHLYDLENNPLLETMDLILFGHIHLPLCEKMTAMVLGNPGSCSLPKEDNPPSYGIIENRTFSVYDLNTQKLICQSSF